MRTVAMDNWEQEGERMCSLQQVVGVRLSEDEEEEKKNKLIGEFGYTNVATDTADMDDKIHDPGRAPRKN